jgi:hypothetical protein
MQNSIWTCSNEENAFSTHQNMPYVSRKRYSCLLIGTWPNLRQSG